MRILQINKFYYRKGGSESHMIELVELLREKGHEVAVFSMHDKNNIKEEHNKYFIGHVDYDKDNGLLDKIRKAGKIIYNSEAKNNLKLLIDEFKPDVAHLHNIAHQLSPSIIDALKEKGVPVVMTLHDWKIICPNYKLFTKGEVCERCKGGKYFNCVKYKCVKDSYAKSAVNALESYYHNKILKIYDKVDLFISPSNFMKQKMIEWGIDGNKIAHLPYFIEAPKHLPSKDKAGDYVIYFGRLAKEKGVMDLIKAVEHTNAHLKIAGTGPQETAMRKYMKDNLVGNVELLGYKDKDELMKLVAGAKFSIINSIWYDNYPMAILESMSLGVPVVASDMGGNSELVTDNFTGMLFKGGDVDGLREIVGRLYNDDRLLDKMSEQCRRIVALNDKDVFYTKLMQLYGAA